MTLPLPDFPLKPKSSTTKQSCQLHKKAVDATRRLTEVENVRLAAEEAVRTISQALDQEIVRSAASGIRSQVEAELVSSLASAREANAPHVHQLRRDSAIAAQHSAVTTFLAYSSEHAGELLRTIRVEADGAAAAYIEAQAAAEELLRGPTARRQEAGELVRALVLCLAGCFPYPADWSVSDELAVSPLPSPALEVIERAENPAAYDERRADEAEAARVEAEERAADARDRDARVVVAGEELGRLVARGHRGQLSHSERESLARGTHPLQTDLERLRGGTLSQALETFHDIELRGMRGHLNAVDAAAIARGNHPAQVAVERLTEVAV
jgi:hypothetical protein